MHRTQITKLILLALLLGAAFWIFQSRVPTKPEIPTASTAAPAPDAPPQSAQQRQPVRVFGKVVDGTGQGLPVADAALHLVTPSGQDLLLDIRSDHQGAFNFVLSRKGTHGFYATDGKAWSYRRRDEMHLLNAGPDVTAIGPLTLYLAPGISLDITTLASTTGEPIANARLTAADVVKHTDSQGKARLVLPADRGLLRVVAAGFVPMRRAFDPGAGQSVSMVLHMQPGGRIEGVVANRQGAALSGAVVTTRQKKHHLDTLSDDDGRFHLDALQAGHPFELTVAKEGYETKILKGQHTSLQQPMSYTLVLKALAGELYEITGLVRAQNGGPLEGAEIRLESTPDLFHDSFTLADGTFRLDEVPLLPESHYVLLVTLDGYAPRALPVAAPVNEREIELIISLSQARSVSGQVQDEDGAAIADVRLTAVCSEAGTPVETLVAVSDNQGKFQLDGLSSQVVLIAEASD